MKNYNAKKEESTYSGLKFNEEKESEVRKGKKIGLKSRGDRGEC